ncbi:hypothetical protein [Geobacillus sp. MR]|nr:hypothetical protein [Geobacillus sp. MR]
MTKKGPSVCQSEQRVFFRFLIPNRRRLPLPHVNVSPSPTDGEGGIASLP